MEIHRSEVKKPGSEVPEQTAGGQKEKEYSADLQKRDSSDHLLHGINCVVCGKGKLGFRCPFKNPEAVYH